MVFLFGCVASSHRSCKALDQGQVSLGIAYDALRNAEESDADVIHLLALDGRIGVFNGLDVGAAHTCDITGDSEGAFSTWWGDAKVQLTNRDNVPGRPILSLGVMKGCAYHEDADTHITSFPVMISVPTSEATMPYFIYRFEDLTEDFIPSEADGGLTERSYRRRKRSRPARSCGSESRGGPRQDQVEGGLVSWPRRRQQVNRRSKKYPRLPAPSVRQRRASLSPS